MPFLHTRLPKERQVIEPLESPCLIITTGAAESDAVPDLPAARDTAATTIAADPASTVGPRDSSWSTPGVEVHPTKAGSHGVKADATLVHPVAHAWDGTSRDGNNQIGITSSARTGELGETVVPTSSWLSHAMSPQLPSASAVPKTTVASDWALTASEQQYQPFLDNKAPLSTEGWTEHPHQVAGCDRLQTCGLVESSNPIETHWAAPANLNVCNRSRQAFDAHNEVLMQEITPQHENQPNHTGLRIRGMDVWSPHAPHLSHPCDPGMRDKEATAQHPRFVNKRDAILRFGTPASATSGCPKVVCESPIPRCSDPIEFCAGQHQSSHIQIAALERSANTHEEGFTNCIPSIIADDGFPISPLNGGVGKLHAPVSQELQQTPPKPGYYERMTCDTDNDEDSMPDTPRTTSIPNSPPDGSPTACSQHGLALSPMRADGTTSHYSMHLGSSPVDVDAEIATPTRLSYEQRGGHPQRTSVDAGPLVIPDTPGTSSKDAASKTPRNLLHQARDAQFLHMSPRQHHLECTNATLPPSASSVDPSPSVRHRVHALSPASQLQFQQTTPSNIAPCVLLETPVAKPHNTIPKGSSNTAEQMLDTQVRHTEISRHWRDDTYGRHPSTPLDEVRSVVPETPYSMHGRTPRTTASSAPTPPNHQHPVPGAARPYAQNDPDHMSVCQEPDVVPESPMVRVCAAGLGGTPQQSHSPHVCALFHDQDVSASPQNRLQDSVDDTRAGCGARPNVVLDTPATYLQHAICGPASNIARPHNVRARSCTASPQQLPPVEILHPMPASAAAQRVVIPDTPFDDTGRASNTGLPRAGDRVMHSRLALASNQKTLMPGASYSNASAAQQWSTNAESAYVPPLHVLGKDEPCNNALAATQYQPQTTPLQVHVQPSMNSRNYAKGEKETLNIDSNRGADSFCVSTNEGPASNTSFDLVPTIAHGATFCENLHRQLSPVCAFIACEESPHQADVLPCNSSLIPQPASRPITSQPAPVTDLSRDSPDERFSRWPEEGLVETRGLRCGPKQSPDTTPRQQRSRESIAHHESDVMDSKATAALRIYLSQEDGVQRKTASAQNPSDPFDQQKLETTSGGRFGNEFRKVAVEVPERARCDPTAADLDRTPSSGNNRSPLAVDSCGGGSAQSDGSEIVQRRLIRRRHQQVSCAPWCMLQLNILIVLVRILHQPPLESMRMRCV